MVTVTYNIDPKHGGIVIGKGGSELRALKAMRGVQNIHFDTRSSTRVYTLKVTGINRSSCDAVYEVIQRKINERSNTIQIPEVARTFIDVDDRSLDVIALRPFGSKTSEAVAISDRGGAYTKKFVISAFKRGSLANAFDINLNDSSQVKPNFMEFMERNVSKSFEEAFENHKSSTGEKLDFHVSPGKVVFTGQSGTELLRSKMIGSNGVDYLRDKGLRTFFTPNLHPRYIEVLNKKLDQLGFENLNAGCPESYTTVHLDVIDGSKVTSFSAILALDKNLETLQTASDDPRLSDDKKRKIDQIISAKTIGEVLGLTSSVKAKMAYFKLTRDVHPDKNQHPGATEAFKKLSDAYEKITAGRPLNSSALAVSSAHNEENKEKSEIPPKVVKVKTKKIRMCVVTTMSAKDLDIRASLKGYEEDKNNLTEHVRDTLNSCWEQRDAEGKISAGKSDIKVSCVKQVLELYTWVKEVPYASSDSGNQTAIVEVKIKKLREKSGNDLQWNDCVEVDFKLNTGKENKKSGEIYASEMMELKNWIKKFFCKPLWTGN